MVSHIPSPEEMYLHPLSELSGQLSQLEVLLGRIAKCEKVALARVEEVVVGSVWAGDVVQGQGQYCDPWPGGVAVYRLWPLPQCRSSWSPPAPSSSWSGQHSRWPGCEVPPVQGQACPGQGLGQAGLADDHQLPGGGGLLPKAVCRGQE